MTAPTTAEPETARRIPLDRPTGDGRRIVERILDHTDVVTLDVAAFNSSI